jgi:hypothetical protein
MKLDECFDAGRVWHMYYMAGNCRNIHDSNNNMQNWMAMSTRRQNWLYEARQLNHVTVQEISR